MPNNDQDRHSPQLLLKKFQSFGLKVTSEEYEKGTSFLILSLEVAILPGSKVEGSKILSNGELAINIVAPPVDGEANRSVLKFLGKGFGIPPSNIEIVKGAKSRHKKLNFRFDFSRVKDVDHYLKKVDQFFAD